jgi:SNF2 family DNA or RNA helicase
VNSLLVPKRYSYNYFRTDKLMAWYASGTTLQALKLLNMPYSNELTEESQRIPMTHPLLKIPLRAHQAAAVHAMMEQEKKLSRGFDLSGERLFGSWSVLGDGVGVGKSLTVLSHIANLKTDTTQISAVPTVISSSPYLYSLSSANYDLSECNASLIIVPHTLYRQWSTYINEQTKLAHFLITNKKDLLSSKFYSNLFKSDVILLSNTSYKDFINRCSNIRFKRVYIDEADSIHISGYNEFPKFHFLWLISASWPNLMFPNMSLWINYDCMANYIFSQNSRFHPEFVEQFRSAYLSHTQYYTYRFHVVSASFFKKLILNGHPLRARLVLRNSVKFIKESISLPQMYRHTVLCRSPISYQVVAGVISTEVRSFLHAGDIQSALQALGVAGDSAHNLIDAVTENRTKELERLKKTYEFKAAIEYSTPQAKEHALLALKQKIQHLESQIQSIRERIENVKDETCPICFDAPIEPLLTPCCQRVFCAQCILSSLARTCTCPLCRMGIVAKDLRKIAGSEMTISDSSQSAPAESSLLLKKDALLKIIKDNPDGRFLVFSRYDNPFHQISEELETVGISSAREVKGNKDVVQALLNRFQAGQVRCLLLNSIHAGAGLTITAATHVILLHAMNLEEEKQILGRAYRMGRTTPLNVYKLVHQDELDTNTMVSV